MLYLNIIHGKKSLGDIELIASIKQSIINLIIMLKYKIHKKIGQILMIENHNEIIKFLNLLISQSKTIILRQVHLF